MPTLEEEDGFLLWESNSIVRYLAAKHRADVLEPADLRTRASASAWMDWQLSVFAPAIFDCFWGLIRTPPEQRNHAAIEESKKRTTAAVTILDERSRQDRLRGRRRFSYGDIPAAVHGQPLSAIRAGAAAAAAFRALVRGDRRAPGVQRPGRRRAAGVAVTPRLPAPRPLCADTM